LNALALFPKRIQAPTKPAPSTGTGTVAPVATATNTSGPPPRKATCTGKQSGKRQHGDILDDGEISATPSKKAKTLSKSALPKTPSKQSTTKVDVETQLSSILKGHKFKSTESEKWDDVQDEEDVDKDQEDVIIVAPLSPKPKGPRNNVRRPGQPAKKK
jgi:hypothetical protein